MGAALAFMTNEIMEENYDFIPGTWYLADVQGAEFRTSDWRRAVQLNLLLTPELRYYYNQMLASLDFGTDAMLDNLECSTRARESCRTSSAWCRHRPCLALAGIAGLCPPPPPKLIGKPATRLRYCTKEYLLQTLGTTRISRCGSFSFLTFEIPAMRSRIPFGYARYDLRLHLQPMPL